MLLKMVRNRRYSSNPSKLLRIHHTFVRSNFDYSSLAYTTAAPSRLQILDPIHNSGIHISLRAFPTPISNLQCLCGKPSLCIRKAYETLCYSKNVSLLSGHINYSIFFQDNQTSPILTYNKD